MNVIDNRGRVVDAWGSCGRKRAYPDKRSAVRWGRARGLHPYKCGLCGWWHLSSMTRDQYRRAGRPDDSMEQ